MISQPGDSLEQEADRIADNVMHMTAAGADDEGVEPDQAIAPLIARQSTGSIDSNIHDAPPIIHQALRSKNHPLDTATRAFFEPRLGCDLSPVRVHAGAEAASAARAINAKAFTTGTHVVFDQGAYQPGNGNGQRLLAHELAHVIQQNSPGRPAAAGVLQRTEYPDCREAQRQPLLNATTNAIADLNTAITLLGQRPLSQHVSDALWLMFRDRSEHRALSASGFLQDIRDGLGGATIECEQSDDFAYGWMCQEDVGGYVRYPGVILSMGNIHLCMGWWDNQTEIVQEHAIIHEAAHMFAHMSDLAYFNFLDCSETPESAAAAATTDVPGVRSSNADCYACLVRLLARMGAQEVADRISFYEGSTLRLEQSPSGTINLTAGEQSTVFQAGVPDPHDPMMWSVPGTFQFRWVFEDEHGSEYPLQNLFGDSDVSQFGSGQTAVIIPAGTRDLLRRSGARAGTIHCYHYMPSVRENVADLSVQFSR